jgi:hypothetical protein
MRGVAFTLGLAALLAITPVQAQDSGCTQQDRNVQCNEFGSIAMNSQSDIRGSPIDVTTDLTIISTFQSQAARWLLFSVRSADEGGSNPVTLDLVHFSTSFGDVVTTRIEHPNAHEINIWVDTLDIPVGTPISLQVHVGSTERGAFRLETLVMAFDRGYSPVKDSQGNEVSLFSFTLLGVNQETSAVAAAGQGSVIEGHKLPGLAAVPLLAALAAAVALARRVRA